MQACVLIRKTQIRGTRRHGEEPPFLLGVRARHLGRLPCPNQTVTTFGFQLVEHLNGVAIGGLGHAPDGCSRQSREVPRRCQRILLRGCQVLCVSASPDWDIRRDVWEATTMSHKKH